VLHLIPAPAHRLALRLAHAVRRRWWRFARPRIVGCRVLALDQAGRVLLIRHSYGPDRWMPPGGGLARGEDPLAAARRELAEETGCALHGAHLVQCLEETMHGAGNRVHVVAGWTFDVPRADGREVIEAGFFALHALPADLAARLHEELPRWITAMSAAHRPDRAALPAPPAPRG
jgi:ADP-ribose pyrophosphatase YjhB (NUDIX family)